MLQGRLLVHGALVTSHILLAYGSNSSGLIGSIVDVDVPEKSRIWQQNEELGNSYYQEWEEKVGEDQPLPAGLAEAMDVDFHKVPSREFQGFLKSLKKSENPGAYTRAELFLGCLPDITPSDDPDELPDLPVDLDFKAEFVFVVSASEGVLINEVDHIPRGEVPTEWTYASFAWYIWTKAVRRADPEAGPPNYSRLDLYVRTDVQSISTRTQIELLLKWAGAEKPGFELPLRPGQSAFFALMGTPVGAEIMSIITNNKAAMHSKGVLEFVVQWDKFQSSKYKPVYHIWARLG